MNVLTKLTQVLAKILEVCNWVVLGFMVVLFILTLFPGDIYTGMITPAGLNETLVDVYGFAIVTSGVAALRVFALGSLFIYGLMAMVFRNVSLIIKVSAGQGRNSQGATPFQSDVTRMVREIGIFLLAVIAVTFIFSSIATAILGDDAVASHLDISMLMMGLLMLCLSNAFAQGEKLQSDVDGLV